MLDRKFIVENADRVKQNCADRGVKSDVDRLVRAGSRRRKKLQAESKKLNRQANEVSKLIGKAKDAAEREAMKERGPPPARAERRRRRPSTTGSTPRPTPSKRTIPNLSHPDAPIGGDDQANREIRRGKHADPRKFDFKPLDHVELGEKLGLIDFEGGREGRRPRLLLPEERRRAAGAGTAALRARDC